MKAYLMVSAVALAGLGLAGAAAAECSSGPLAPGGFYSVCALESGGFQYSDPYCSYDDSWNNLFDGFAYNFFNSVFVYAQAHAGQYSYDDSCNFGWYDYAYQASGTDVSAYSQASSPAGFTYGGAYFDQYDYSYSCCGGYGFQQSGTQVGAYRWFYTPAGAVGGDVGYGQYSFNGGACQEYAYVYTSAGVYQTVGPQPCTAEFPQVPTLPTL